MSRKPKMTDLEIRTKIAEYQTSDAPFGVKQAAIQKLEEGLAHKLAAVRKQIEEGQSDLDSSDHLN